MIRLKSTGWVLLLLALALLWLNNIYQLGFSGIHFLQ
jgi:hypothetical protein